MSKIKTPEEFIGNLLRVGVLLSASLVFVGALVYLAHNGLVLVDYRIFQAGPQELTHPGGIIKQAFSFSGRALIQLGVLALIATPVARVAFSILVFIRQQDRMYMLITTVVFMALLFSLFFSR